MTCKSCKYQFCWLCLEQYNPSHYTSATSSCNGLQFLGYTSTFSYRRAELPRSNPDIVPPPIYLEKATVGKPVPGLVEPKKKRRFLAMPSLHPILRRKKTQTKKYTPKNNSSIRICILGESGVGKSPFIIQYVSRTFIG